MHFDSTSIARLLVSPNVRPNVNLYHYFDASYRGSYRQGYRTDVSNKRGRKYVHRIIPLILIPARAPLPPFILEFTTLSPMRRRDGQRHDARRRRVSFRRPHLPRRRSTSRFSRRRRRRFHFPARGRKRGGGEVKTKREEEKEDGLSRFRAREPRVYSASSA